MKTWLITGGAGFIGSNLVRMLVTGRRERVIVFDALTYAGNLANIRDLLDEGSAVFVHADLRDFDQIDSVFREYDIDRVVHCAAESHVDRSILGPRAFVETNVTGTLNLMIAACAHWRGGDRIARRFLHVSTDEVFGALDPGAAPFSESSRHAPNSPYAASKAASDHLVRAWHATYGLPAIITNCSNNFGPRQFPEKVIPLMALNAIEGRELPIYGDGLQSRDWLHVDDHCRALLSVADAGVPGETYCIGGNNEIRNLDLVRMICDLVDQRLGRSAGTARALIRHVADRPGHDRRYAVDSTKLRRLTGWSNQVGFSEGLEAAIDWYLANPQWVETIRSGEYRRFYQQQYAARLEHSS